jgi:hypothetical protein
MSSDLSIFNSPDLKDTLNELKELFSQSDISFLLGAGCSKPAGLPLMQELTKRVLDNEKVDEDTKSLLAKISDDFTGSSSASIEDFMSELVDALSIAERRQARGATKKSSFVGGREHNADDMQKALDGIKNVIASVIESADVDIAHHQRFVRTIHRHLQSGKVDRSVDYYILNYDTLIEDALGLERISYSDGFTGAATGWWEPKTFLERDKCARVYKIHGSVDWCLLEGDALPRRIRSKLKTESPKKHILIYPAATKYQETQRDPFAQMLRDFRLRLCPPEGKEMILVVCGYSFHDAHIDSEIENALYQSRGKLTVLSFTSGERPPEILDRWRNDPEIGKQVRVYTNRGIFHGSDEQVSDHDMPWWRFEVLSRVLGGER